MSEALELKTDTIREALAGVLTRYLGETMARSSIQVHCERLAVADSMSRDQLDTLIAKVGAGLNVFVGRERATQVIAEMKDALIQGGGGR